MKLFCVFFTLFVLVNGVLIDQEITNYKKEVVITNSYIQQASDYNHSSVGGNGLEYVIKSIVYEDEYWIDQLSYMIAVPDKANLTNIQEPISEYIDQEKAMQKEIINNLPLLVTQVPDQNFSQLDLTQLGENRRLRTGKAVKKLIRRALGLDDPDTTFSQLCSYIGLMASTKIAKVFTTVFNTDPVICLLWDGADHYIKYKTIKGIFYQVDNDTDTEIEPLSAQLV
ncbi:uncharacterized protein LOC126836211 [Adelges cooleyi]|uniref:uncharacterized protein LOC126836211 n=1 Tax=Adelges cooleyi TaxID=133065 RepID=UPI00217F84CC|nr:uncharacterized protein LOC126836211 [Adelges cooleyi]XP_050425375.1 uncharacterized protein LOC126836211 [Adelges cooleyi]